MSAGTSGTFVIAWAQTELDGHHAPDPSTVYAGAPWRWHGTSVRVDGPQDRLLLSGALGLDRFRARVRTRLGAPPESPFDALDPVLSQGFSVTDGRSVYWLSLIETDGPPLLVCHEGFPPEGVELWVVRCDLADHTSPSPSTRSARRQVGIAGTVQIDTPDGPRTAGSLSEGDRVVTRSGEVLPISWIGKINVSQARLMLMPNLRPMTDHAHVLSVAPDQPVLLTGRAAQDLFNAQDVLAPASSIPAQWHQDNSLRAVSYVQLVLPKHAVLTAGDHALASTHLSDLNIESLPRKDQSRLLALWPDLDLYGPYARRLLTQSETALMHAA